MKRLFIIAVIVGYCSALLSTLAYGRLWDNAYYHLNSFAFVMYALALFATTIKTFEKSKRMKLFVIFVLLNTLSNFVDETLYDATTIEWNDLIRLITITIITLQCRIHLR